MANSYNSNPIVITATMTSGWKANQTLYASAAKAFGLRVTKVLATGAIAAGAWTIVDPNDSTILDEGQVVQGAVAAQFPDVLHDFQGNFPAWRDFKVTAIPTGASILIWYHN